MGFVANLFKKAGEIDRLTRELDFANRRADEIEKLLVREESRNILLEKESRSERKAHNLALRRTADIVCRQQKLPQHFVDDAAPKVEAPEEVNEAEESRILEVAMQTRQYDIDDGQDNVPEIEWYVDKVRKEGLDSLIIS